MKTITEGWESLANSLAGFEIEEINNMRSVFFAGSAYSLGLVDEIANNAGSQDAAQGLFNMLVEECRSESRRSLMSIMERLGDVVSEADKNALTELIEEAGSDEHTAH